MGRSRYKVNTQEWKTSSKVSSKFWPNLAGGVRLCSPSINSTCAERVCSIWILPGLGLQISLDQEKGWGLVWVAHFPLSPLTRPAHDNKRRELPEGRRSGSRRIKRSQARLLPKAGAEQSSESQTLLIKGLEGFSSPISWSYLLYNHPKCALTEAGVCYLKISRGRGRLRDVCFTLSSHSSWIFFFFFC